MGRHVGIFELGLVVRVFVLVLVRVRKHVHPGTVASHDGDLVPRGHRRDRRIGAIRHHVQVGDMQHRSPSGRITVSLVVLVLLLREEKGGRQQQQDGGG